MRIDRLHVRGFGRLEGVSLTPDAEFTLLFGPNECGKSTLLEFILAMLYGFPSGRIKSVADNRRVRYTPWRAGADFGGVLVLTHNGTRYEIDRRFGHAKSGDKTTLLRAVSGEEIPLGKKEPGEFLLRMTRGEFLNTVYILQDDLAVRSDREIEQKLMNTVSGAETEGSAREMEAALTDYRKELDNDRSRKPALRARAVLEKEALEADLEAANAQETLRAQCTEAARLAGRRAEALAAETERIGLRLALRKEAEELESDRRLLARWAALDEKTAHLAALRNEAGPLPDAERAQALSELLRDWENRVLETRALQGGEDAGSQESLCRQIEEVETGSAALAKLEAEAGRLAAERREMLDRQAEEERAWNEARKELERAGRERAELEEELSDRRARLSSEREKLAQMKERYGRGGAPGLTRILVLAGAVLIAAGLTLSLGLRQPLWHILTGSGAVLILAGLILQRLPGTDASCVLLSEIETDIRDLETGIAGLEQKLAALPEPSQEAPYVQSEELAARYAAYGDRMSAWQEDARRIGVSDPEEAALQKRAYAERLGTLQEREQRLLELRRRMSEARGAETKAADAFSAQSAAWFTADTADEAREALTRTEQALALQKEAEAEIRQLRERIAEDRGGRSRAEVETRVTALSAQVEGGESPSQEEAERLLQELSRLESALSEAKEAEMSARLRLEQTRTNPVIPSTVEYEIELAEAKIAGIDEEIAATDLALAVLEESLLELQESFGEELNKVMAGHLAELTGQTDLSVSVDRDFSVKITDPDTRARRDQGYFSAGKTDQIMLALRMAISEVVYRREDADPLPLILDDTMDRFDAGRARRTLEKLMQSAKTHGHQVLFASCHERIRDFVREEGGLILAPNGKERP